MSSRPGRGVIVAVVATLLVAAFALPAAAHVTVSTDNPAPAGFAVYTVRVPNESDTAATTRVEVRMPEGLEASRYEPLPDWEISLQDGVLLAEGGEIAPGQFREFRFQARNPAEPVDLVFPAVQTYDDGDVVSWTGAPDSSSPASVVSIGATTDGAQAAEDPAGGVELLTVVALVIAIAALLAAGAALAAARGRTR